MTDQTRLRLFVAASLPPEHLEYLDACTDELRARWPTARWTTRENRHVTLKFLGSTPGDLLGRIRAVAESVAAAGTPSSIGLAGPGAFPSAGRARVLWVGLGDPDGLLPRLAAGLDDGLAGLGYEPEKRRFSPHVTLARFRDPVRIDPLPEVPPPPPPFALAAFGLWRSHLSPKGARYELLESFALGSGHGS